MITTSIEISPELNKSFRIKLIKLNNNGNVNSHNKLLFVHWKLFSHLKIFLQQTTILEKINKYIT